MKTLTQERYISLATWRRDGREVRTPVWFANVDENTLYIFSAANAGKVKRLRNSSKAGVARCDLRGGKLGEWHDADAYLVTDSTEIELGYTLLGRKYGLQMAITNLFSWLGGRINKRAVIRVELRRESS